MDDDGEGGPFWIVFTVLCIATVFMAFALLIYSVGAANAQAAMCKPFPELRAILSERYQEHQSAFGLVGSEQIFVLFQSDRGKTWTLVSVGTSGIACMIGAGKDWTPADTGT